MSAGLSTRLATGFEDAVARVRDALARTGFGVLTEIDIKATLKAELDVEIEDYLILGACDPAMAYRAISMDREIGLLLPCNVVVRADPDDAAAVIVEGINPAVLVLVTGEAELAEIAEAVTEKLGAVIASLAPNGR